MTVEMKTASAVLCLVIISLHSIQCIDDTSSDGNRIGAMNATAGNAMGIDKGGNGGDAGGGGGSGSGSGGGGGGDSGGNDTNSADESMDFDKTAQATDDGNDDNDGDAIAICNKTFTIPIGRFSVDFPIFDQIFSVLNLWC